MDDFDYGWAYEDEDLQRADARLAAELDAEREQWRQEQIDRRATRRSRATGTGTAGTRRSASAPAESRRQRKQRRTRPTATSAAPSGSLGQTGAGTSAPEAAAAAGSGLESEMAQLRREVEELTRELQREEAAEAAAAAAEGSEAEPSAWSRRCQQAETGWRKQAPSLGAAVLQLYAAPDQAEPCSRCGTSIGCSIRCWTCSPEAGCKLFCDACDQLHHRHVHLHKRQKYVDGCWRDLPRAHPLNGYFTFKPSKCMTCGCCSFEDIPVKLQPLDYITRDGVVAAKRAAFQCSNPDCKTPTGDRTYVWHQPEDFVRVGAWPASTDNIHCRTVVAQDLLQLYDSLKLCAPTLSLSAFTKAVADAAWHINILQPRCAISNDAFRRAADEYSSCQLDLRLGVKMINDLICPACSGGNCAYHIDSNMKLFVWQRNRQLWRQPHFHEFFAQDADVQLTIKSIDSARGETGAAGAAERENTSCNGVWAAAGDGQQRRQSKQAVTGRCVATDARHGVPRIAANLVNSGERYGYALHLLGYHLPDCQQLHIDVMCKWGPWLKRTREALQRPAPAGATPEEQARLQQARIVELRQLVAGADSIRQVLSHAHGTLHALNCQVLWQPGWTEGCAMALGEEGEQLFAYLSKFAFTTRNQSVAGSMDQLTKAAVHFARHKLLHQARQLVKRLKKFQELLPTAEAKLAEELQSLQQTPAAQRPALVQRMKVALRALAEAEIAAPRDQNKRLLERYSEAVRVREAHELMAAVNNSIARFGMERERLAAVRIMAGLTDPNVAQLHDLTTKLCESAGASSTAATQADAIIQQQFAPALDASIVRLQNIMEGLCHDLKKQETKRDAKAATPKERQRHSKKCKELVSTLSQRVQQYNVLVQEYNKGGLPASAARTTTTLDDVRSQRFCWVNEYSLQEDSPLRMYGVARAMAVCEADNKVARIKEELQLLPGEMHAHLSYYRGLLARLQQVEAALSTSNAPTAEQLQSAGYVTLSGQGRYQPAAQAVLDDASVRAGVLTFLRTAQAEVRERLAVAVKHFAKAGLVTAAGGVHGGGESDGAEEDSEDGDMVPPNAPDVDEAAAADA